MINDSLRPINPEDMASAFSKPKSYDDILIEGINNGISAADICGEDATILLIEALKKMGRRDLLPPCCR